MKEQIKQIIKENAWEMEKDRFVIGSNNIDEIAECVVKLFRQYAVISLLPDSDEIRMKARELDEKDFAQWVYDIQKGNDL